MSKRPLVSAASADAQLISPDKETSVPDNSEKTTKFSRQTKQYRHPTGSRHGGVAYEQKAQPTSLQIVPRRHYFPIFTSNQGCVDLVRECYDTMIAKDHRLGQHMALHHMQYATCIALFNRMVQCGITYGYSFPRESSRLKQLAHGIQLPSVLATYVESVGLVKMHSGLAVVPYITDYAAWIRQSNGLLVDANDLLGEEDRPAEEHWALSADRIVQYNGATTRASRTGMRFRSVDNTEYIGRVEMLVSYTRIATMLLPKAPQSMSAAEAQLGACYRFRDYSTIEEWPGENKQLLFDGFTTIPIEPRVVFSDLCVAAFKGASISMD